MTPTSRPALLFVACTLAVLASCGDRPDTDQATGSLSGTVYVSGPVEGAVVSAFELDRATGEVGDVIALSEPTTEDGAFTLDMGAYSGDVLLEARGAAAGYREPASGADASFEASTRLRAVLVDWETVGVSLDFGFDFADERQDVVIGPWSELAYSYAEARDRLGLSNGFSQALEDAVLIWWDHLQHDYWRVAPLSLTEAPVGPFNERVHAGVLAAGLSYHARRIAVESSLSPAAVSSLSILDSLKLDLADSVAQLDGLQTGSSTPITLGACPAPAGSDEATICELSGQTLRSRLNEAVGLFLLDEAVNKSGLVYNDVKTIMQAIACRTSALFPAEPCVPDSLAPVIEFIGVQDNDPVTGELSFTVRVRDEQEMGAILPVEINRGADEGQNLSPLSVIRDTSNPAAHSAEVLLDSPAISDGALQIIVTARDAAGNERVAMVSVNVDNTGKGSIFGNVMVGGRCDGCFVTAYDMTDGVRGDVLGTATTEPNGDYDMPIAESPLTTSLLVIASKPIDAEATYREMTSGAVISFSSGDELESVIVDYVDGETGRIVNVNPYTHMAAALARGRFADGAGVDVFWTDAVTTSYTGLDEHFADGGPTINVQTVRPADVTVMEEVGTLTAQVRMGLLVAALGEVANAHAAASAQGPTTMNTFTLTKVLAEDLSFDSAIAHAGCDSNPCGPIFNGLSGAVLSHGVVTSTSFWTRADLAVGLVQFLEGNLRDETAFTEVHVQTLLETMSIDDNSVLYDEPGRPYDSIPPCTSPAVCAFETPTPGEGSVLRGLLSLRVTVQDNRALLPGGGLVFSAPAGVVVDTITAPINPEDPWLGIALLDTDALPEGPTAIEVTVTDEALNTATITRNVVVDRTPPDIVVTEARSIPEEIVVPSGAVTGAEELSLVGTVSDLNGVASLTMSQNGGPASSVGFSGGTWEADASLVDGLNTFVFTATDFAGNVRTGVSVSYTRDGTPPVLTSIETIAGGAATVESEASYVVSVSGSGAGTVSYAGAVTDQAVASGLSFSKYPTRYFDATQDNLPEWRYDVADNTTADSNILFEFRISRGGTVLVDWTAAAPVGGATFNRAVLVSADLHPELGNVSGTYTIQARATDEFGNVTATESATWTQTILPPPMRFETTTAPTGFGAIGGKFPIHYSLDVPVSGGPGNNFSGLMNGSGAHGGELYVARWRVTNPNPIPIRVRVATPAVDIAYQSGRIYRQPIHDTASMGPGPCSLNRERLAPDNSCYVFPIIGPETPGTENVLSSTRSVATGATVTTSAGVELSSCAGCASNEWELPVGFDGFVFATSAPFSFLDSQASQFSDIASVGDLTNKTGISRSELSAPSLFFRNCDEIDTIAGMAVCVAATKREAFKSMTRVKIDFTRAEATLEARADATGAFQIAETTTAALSGGVRNVNTSDDDFSNFP